MAKGPAVIIIARHGARLDAADKSWHLTSPTPYDPPLTWGGWSQGRALGLRIQALLHQRDSENSAARERNGSTTEHSPLDISKLNLEDKERPDAPQRRKKKRKFIIHSSPFLRCVQTSTAIAAGLSQYQPAITPQLNTPKPSKLKNEVVKDPDAADSPQKETPRQLPTAFEPVADPRFDSLFKPRKGFEKVLLRIDAFLGEWLSPDYYEDITPPPNSTLMVASAKADLLRRSDYIQEAASGRSIKGHFPGGWMGKGGAALSAKTNDGSSATQRSMAQASLFTGRERSNSQGDIPAQRPQPKDLKPVAGSGKRDPSKGYEPPMPSYSVAATDPIPRGYFGHAREACIEADFQWDSMRPPQEWGDGGQYGDEWSTMHKRFRRGLAGMLQWYREHGTAPPKDLFPGFMFRHAPLPLLGKPKPVSEVKNDDDTEDDEELVLILVTHGAGCNALLGAVTNQPVLTDVGLASLSMATRRVTPRQTAVPSIHERRLSLADASVSDYYEIQQMASVDHLRPGVDPSKPPLPQSQAPSTVASPSLESRRRFTGSSTANSPLESPLSLYEPVRTWSNSGGSGARRTASSGSNSRFMSGVRTQRRDASPAGGLWAGARPNATEATSEPRSQPATETGAKSEERPPKAGLSAFQSTTKPSAQPTVSPITTTNDTTNPAPTTETEAKENGDKVTALPTGRSRAPSTSAPGLWGAKAPTKANTGLWGPPRMDDLYEHRGGPKRRWTVTEREEGP